MGEGLHSFSTRQAQIEAEKHRWRSGIFTKFKSEHLQCIAQNPSLSWSVVKMARRFLVQDGILKALDIPPAPIFLTSNHPGAYTTSRTGGDASCILLWERHLLRLSQSVKLLAQAKPELYPVKPRPGSTWDDVIRPLVRCSLVAGLPKALEARENGELAITTLVCGSKCLQSEKACTVYVHISSYMPPVLSAEANAAHLAVVGAGREIAESKFSEWVRTRQCLEKLRPPSATELLLSNDGDMLLEGTITNFFVVCYKERDPNRDDDFHQSTTSNRWIGYEVQTAPVADGILPGVIRQLVIEICAKEGIALREVAPSWSNCQSWKEAFVTNSLRLVQHVGSIQAPSSWKQQFYAHGWKEIAWESLQLEGHGLVTQEIQKHVSERAVAEGYPVMDFLR